MSRKARQTYETAKDTFPKKLTELMTKNRVTQTELAKSLEVTRQAVSLYANGQSTPDINVLYKIAKYFNVSTDFLLGLSDGSSANINEREMVDALGLKDRSIKTLQLMKNKCDTKTCNWHNYYHYLEMINILTIFGNHECLLETLHDYLFFDTTKATVVDFCEITDSKGIPQTKELPLNCITLSDGHKILSVPTDVISEPILEAILISKIKSLKKEIQENKLTKTMSLLEEDNKKSGIEENKD